MKSFFIAAASLLAGLQLASAKAVKPVKVHVPCAPPYNRLAHCLQHTPALASPFCSSYLSVLPSTVTVTTTPSATLTAETVASTEISTSTSTIITTTTTVLPVTSTTTTFTTSTATAVKTSTTTTGRDPVVTKRKIKASPSLKCTTYAPDQMSSACSCLLGTATETAATFTSTVYSSVTTTTTTTASVTSTTVFTSTTTGTDTATSIVKATTTTTTTTNLGEACTRTAFTGVNTASPDLTAKFARIFEGRGAFEVANNPGNTASNSLKTIFPGNFCDCDATQKCLNFATLNGFSNIDVHYLLGSHKWSCTAFQGRSSKDYYNGTDINIGAGYGYNAL